MKVILAMDLGTTGNRVAAFSRNGEVVAKAYYEFNQIFPQPGWVEHDPEEIWETACRALKEVTAHVGRDNVEALGITNQRETTVVWDRRTGKPVFNAIVWQCRRTAPQCEALKAHAPEVKEKTGLFIDAYFSATKIRWILDHVEKAPEKAQSGDLIFGTIDTWILWKLTGGKVHATEVSNASRTLCFNIQKLAWDDELLRLFGVPRAMLPEVKESGAEFGAVDKDLLGREIPITGILGDQQASLFAQGGWEEGVFKNTYGTGLFVMTATGEKIPNSGRLVNTVGWKLGGRVQYAMEGSIFVGGSAIQWLRDGLKVLSSAEETDAMARSLESNEGVYFVPALVGLGAPYWNSEARGVITGLTRGSRPEHLARAALESLAYQTRDVVDEMNKVMPERPFKLLRVDGGAVKNDFLMQFQADILGASVERPVQTETTVFGAAGIAGIFSGFWSQEEFMNVHKTDRLFHPEMEQETIDKYYGGWRKAVERCLT